MYRADYVTEGASGEFEAVKIAKAHRENLTIIRIMRDSSSPSINCTKPEAFASGFFIFVLPHLPTD